MNVLLTNHITHQCAWCLCLMVDGHKVEDCNKVLDTSHGICLDCMEKMYEKELV